MNVSIRIKELSLDLEYQLGVNELLQLLRAHKVDAETVDGVYTDVLGTWLTVIIKVLIHVASETLFELSDNLDEPEEVLLLLS